MIKTLLTYLIVFTALFLSANYLHQYILEVNEVVLRFELKEVYVFFGVISFVLCLIFSFLQLVEKLKNQLGFIYLSTLVLKIFLFAVLFKNSVIDLPNLTKTESLSLLIPIFIFLIAEVYFIAKILQQKT